VSLTIGQFYDADSRRRTPGERQFGDHWQSADEPGCDDAVYRLLGTGELIAMRAPHGRPTAFGSPEAVVAPHYGEADFTVDVLGVLDPPEAKSPLLDGSKP
jgi:hypothetical protein